MIMLEINRGSAAAGAQLTPLFCGSFPPSQNGFSSSNMAAFRVLSSKLQLSSWALFTHFLASAKALKIENIRRYLCKRN